MTLLAGLELSLLLVCLWGFVAVLLTGQFSAVVIAGCMIALVFGYRIRRTGWKPNSLSANIAAISVFIVAGGIFLATLNLLIATVYLFLFLQVTKYVTRRSLTESRWCYIISLFNIIGASVITTAIAFGAMLVVYIFLVLLSLRLYVLAREWESTLTAGSRTGDKPSISVPGSSAAIRLRNFQQQPMPRGMLRGTALFSLGIMLLAGILFSAIPRLATQNLFQSYGPPAEEPAVSAFSENVEFGTFTEIQQDNAIAMFVEPTGKSRPTNVRMRGVALDTFDGKSWSRTSRETMGSHKYEYHPLFTTRIYNTVYHYRVIQPPGITKFLFGDSFPLEIQLRAPFMFNVDRMAQSVYLQEMPPKEFQYEVDSMHEDLSRRSDPTKSQASRQPPSRLVLERRKQNDDDDDGYEFYGSDPDGLEESNWTSSPKNQSRFLNRMLKRLARRLNMGIGMETTNSSVSDTPPHYKHYAYDPDNFHSSATNRTGIWSGGTYQPKQHHRSSAPVHHLTGEEILHRYLTKCLVVPANLSRGRVGDLARQWTRDANTTFTKAIAVEHRLRTEYRYTLTPQARGNFIDDFLFRVREGHCEYFATSMAVLLRDVGIPARVVNGYYSSEWNSISSNFTVRQKDAHSWVEAWMGDTYGWMTFDPTPPGGVTRRAPQNAALQAFSRFSDAVKMRWYRYVVDYSISDQADGLRSVLNLRRQLMASLKRMDIMGISADDATEIKFGDFTAEIDWRPVAAAAMIVLLLLFWQAVRWVWQRKRNRISTVRYYDDLLRLLARRGLIIGPGQTPLEFARKVSTDNPQWKDFVQATRIYYESLYTGRKPDADAHDMLSRLKRQMRRRKTKD